MRAVRFHGRKDIRLDEVDEPNCGRDQVKIKPSFVGLCGTDLHEYLHGPIVTAIKPHTLTKDTIPVTLGHEFAGTVEEVGEDVQRFQVGDRVAVLPLLYDGTCDACKRGYINCCSSSATIGYTVDGGLADHVVLPQDNVYKLPSSMSLETGALIEPLAVAWHAVSSSPFRPTDSILVLGCGPIGLGVIQVLAARGARTIIASEIEPQRKALARHFGAHHVLDPSEGDIAGKCIAICGGHGVDVVFDAAGVQAGLDAAIKSCRVGASIVNIAAWKGRAEIDTLLMILGEKRFQAVFTYVRRDFEEVIEAVAAGKLKPDAMITKKVKLERVEEDGLKSMIKNVKILVDVHG